MKKRREKRAVNFHIILDGYLIIIWKEMRKKGRNKQRIEGVILFNNIFIMESTRVNIKHKFMV